MSFELGGHMGYQNSYLDESFHMHPKNWDFFWKNPKKLHKFKVLVSTPKSFEQGGHMGYQNS